MAEKTRWHQSLSLSPCTPLLPYIPQRTAYGLSRRLRRRPQEQRSWRRGLLSRRCWTRRQQEEGRQCRRWDRRREQKWGLARKNLGWSSRRPRERRSWRHGLSGQLCRRPREQRSWQQILSRRRWRQGWRRHQGHWRRRLWRRRWHIEVSYFEQLSWQQGLSRRRWRQPREQNSVPPATNNRIAQRAHIAAPISKSNN
jgi:hypothetical protein